MTDPTLHARLHDHIGAIDATRWDACAGTGNPFVSHAFLKALEDSGCVVPETGWLPQHLTLHGPGGTIDGVMPLYLKSHSQGEYVFDHGWADAFMQAGGRYYPKLQCSVPFSPVTGPRLMAAPDVADPLGTRRALTDAARAATEKLGVSSLHVTFAPEDQWKILGDAGFLLRVDQQFHWLNDGYQSFDDFLAALSSRKRKAIRRERRDALADGIEVRTLTGNDITEAHWDAFHDFYMDTGLRKWGRPYLNRDFFSLLGERLGERVVLALAFRNGRAIAGALNLCGDDTLYGRYWGCREDHPFLHFELCYYRAIDYAITHGLKRVEAGAQGPHKLARGYLPTPTFSAHWIEHPGLRDAVARFLERERRLVSNDMAALGDYSPFRRNED
ncbi:MAG: GNAT family N-acetyltransferase [Sphingomonadales bacterium]